MSISSTSFLKPFTQKPILVTGSIRSGTTFCGRILSMAPKVGYIHEPFRQYRGFQRIRTNYLYQYINDSNEDVFKDEIFKTLNFNYKYIERRLLRIPLTEIVFALKFHIESLENRILRNRPLLKDPFAIFSAPWFFENSLTDVVIMIRHPAAMISSLNHLKWTQNFSYFIDQPELVNNYLTEYRNEIEEFARTEHSIIEQSTLLWRIIYSTVIQYQKKYPSWNYIRQEDLSENPIEEFKSLYNKLGLKYTKEVESKILNYTEQDRFSDPILKDPFSLKRNSKANKTLWKSRLTEAEINYIKSQVGEISSKFYSENEW